MRRIGQVGKVGSYWTAGYRLAREGTKKNPPAAAASLLCISEGV